MPADMQKLNQTKDLIITFLRARGPSLPVHIARDVNTSPLFASAFLSELYNEGKIKMSQMKVGSSPLYYLPEQLFMLENFSEFLNNREKEALALLKKEIVLSDEQQPPVIRVALREIKDFAIGFHIRIDGEQRLFWKYFKATETEVKSILSERYEQKKKMEKQEHQEKHKEIEKTHEKQSEKIAEKTEKATEKHVEKIKEKIKEMEVIKPEIKKEKEKKQKIIESEFTRKIKEYFAAKDIEVLQIIEEKKKEFIAKVRIDTLFGKQEFYLIAKDKKKVKEEDLTHVLYKAQNEKMPALFMAPGDIDKKALDTMKDWRNLVKFEKIKF